jgi:hypothetical protein
MSLSRRRFIPTTKRLGLATLFEYIENRQRNADDVVMTSHSSIRIPVGARL